MNDKKEEVAYLTETAQDAKDFLEQCYDEGIEWVLFGKAISPEDCGWESHKERTCFFVENGKITGCQSYSYAFGTSVPVLRYKKGQECEKVEPDEITKYAIVHARQELLRELSNFCKKNKFVKHKYRKKWVEFCNSLCDASTKGI